MCYNLKKSQDHDHVNITQSKYFRGQLLNHNKQEEFWCFWQKWRSVQVLMCSISFKNKHFNPYKMFLGSFLCFQWINMEEEQHFGKFSCILKNTNETIFIPKILQCLGIQISMAILQQCFHANQRKVTRLDKSFISKQITGFFLENRGPFLVSSCVWLELQYFLNLFKI